jgi:hypothetical protein
MAREEMIERIVRMKVAGRAPFKMQLTYEDRTDYRNKPWANKPRSLGSSITDIRNEDEFEKALREYVKDVEWDLNEVDEKRISYLEVFRTRDSYQANFKYTLSEFNGEGRYVLIGIDSEDFSDEDLLQILQYGTVFSHALREVR